MKKTFELKRCHIDVLLLCIIFLIGAFIVYRQINGNKIEKFYDLKQDDLSERNFCLRLSREWSTFEYF